MNNQRVLERSEKKMERGQRERCYERQLLVCGNMGKLIKAKECTLQVYAMIHETSRIRQRFHLKQECIELGSKI